MKERIASPAKTIEILQKTGFRFAKKYGQNFLIDLHVLDKILNAAEIGPDSVCVEIGPGIGGLTQVLAENAAHVIAVEIDGRLIPILQENLADYPNIRLIQADFLKLDLKKTLEEDNVNVPIHVIANLPYYITTPIIMELFESGIPLANMTVMVQEEVAQRMQAGPGTKDYGALSLAVQYYAEAEIVAYVPQNCFMPRPGVRSAVIRLRAYPEKPVQAKDERFMFAVIKAAFGQRRKQLINSLSGAEGLNIPKEKAQEALQKMGLSPQIRGEALTLKQFAELADLLYTEHQSNA